MKLTTITHIALFVFMIVTMPVATAQAGDNSYEDAKAQNRGHVGIHQRREAFREHFANSGTDNNASSMAEIAPAAGEETEKNTSEDSQAQPAQRAPQYNQ